jgi:hypothetical protein
MIIDEQKSTVSGEIYEVLIIPVKRRGDPMAQKDPRPLYSYTGSDYEDVYEKCLRRADTESGLKRRGEPIEMPQPQA